MIGSKLNQSNNIYYTPPYAILPILKLIPKDFVIWESANGKGHITNILRENGFKVITSDITTGQDFLNYEPTEHYDMIITNPPFKHKTKFLQRCYFLGKPFLLLTPINMIESKKRYKLFNTYGISYFQLPYRVDFIKENGTLSKSPFWCMWIGKVPGVESRTINFLTLPKT